MTDSIAMQLSHSTADLLDNSQKNETQTTKESKSKQICSFYKNKNLTIIFAAASIALVWITFIVFSIIIAIFLPLNYGTNGRIRSLIDDNISLPTELNCTQNFVYSLSDRGCFPPCDWNQIYNRFAIKLILKIVSISSLVIGLFTISIWSAVCMIDFRKCKRIKCASEENANLAKFSLFMVIAHSVILAALDTSLYLLNDEILICRKNDDGQLYLPGPQALYNQPHDKQLIINILGAGYHYNILALNAWVINAFLSIAFIIQFPLKYVKSYSFACCLKFIFLAEVSFLCIFIIGLTFALNYEAPINSYAIGYIFYFIVPFRMSAFILLYSLPYYLSFSCIATLAIFILLKLRLIALDLSTTIGQKTRKLTPLEKRIFAYGIMLIILFVLITIVYVVAISIARLYRDNFELYLNCISTNSLILASETNKTLMPLIRTNLTYATFGLQDCSLRDSFTVWKLLPGTLLNKLIPYLAYVVVIPYSSMFCFTKSKKVTNTMSLEHIKPPRLYNVIKHHSVRNTRTMKLENSQIISGNSAI